MAIAPHDITLYVPVRNAGRTLADAIASIRAQSLAPAECFLLLDCRSTDDSIALARASGLRIVEQHDGRLGHARNLALRACQTRYLASCDADVTLEPHWLARLAERMRPGVALVGGCTHERPITPADRWRALNMPHNWGPAPLDNPFMLVSEMLADTRALRAVGGYRADLQVWEDSDCCQRLRQAGYRLRYEPAAVAWHDRRDSVQSVLDLRWFYASYRQRQHFESLAGLAAKLAVNRTYTLQSLGQTLHSDQADTAGIAVLLWFHHALRDLAAGLEHWPLLPETQRSAALAHLRCTLEQALHDDWPRFAALPGRLLPQTWCGPAAAPAPAASPPDADEWTTFTDTRGFQRHLELTRKATSQLLAELDGHTRLQLECSADVLESRSASPIPGPARPQTTRAAAALMEQLEAQPLQPAWSPAQLGEILHEAGAPPLDAARVLEWGRLLPAERAQSASAPEGAPRLLLAPHLETAPDPRAALHAALATADWAVLAYQPPPFFHPALPVLSARDLAIAAAAAGMEIRGFFTQAGLTRLVLRRRPAPRIAVRAQPRAHAAVAVR